MWFIDYIANGMPLLMSMYQAGFYGILPSGIKHYADARIEVMFE